jgi:AraC-like DNA-binding protein
MYVHQNYYDFINSYRLEEFKRRLADKAYSRYTLIALSEQCGFKKSSFFSTFKKMMGITPAEYLHQIGKQ